jgi:beta-glucosidase/6-phospho-beta-glucosidase/beta-galactosidase
MQGVARNFFTLAIIYALCGMALGLHMSITHDHGQMPVHAHTMVAGWLMSSVFAFFYHLFPAAADTLLARVHFWLATVSGIVLLIGLYMLLGGNPTVEPVVAVASIGFYVAMFLFAIIALPAVYRRA